MTRPGSARHRRSIPKPPAELASRARQPAPVPQRAPHPALLAAGYAIFTLAGVLSAIYEVLLVPTRWGSTLIPLAPALAIISNVALPIISRNLTDTVLSALPPVLGWFVTVFVLASARPEGDVLLPAGKTSWVSYGLLICGALAGAATIALGNQPRDWFSRQWQRRRAVPAGSGSGDAR